MRRVRAEEVKSPTILHRETLLVVTTADANDVSLELVAKGVNLNFLGDALVPEDTGAAVIVNAERLLGTRGRVSEVELPVEESGQQSSSFRSSVYPLPLFSTSSMSLTMPIT